jgi:co-chaperonin GroES (HSP10)
VSSEQPKEAPTEDIYVLCPDHRSMGYMVLLNHPTKQATEEMLGSRIPDEIWDFQPWGSRILVRRDKEPDMVGSLFIPDDAKEPLQSGTIVKVGVGVGTLEDSDCPYSDPSNLVGLPITFGQWAGKVLMTSEDHRKDPYAGNWLLMHENDIWGHSNCLPQQPEDLIKD